MHDDTRDIEQIKAIRARLLRSAAASLRAQGGSAVLAAMIARDHHLSEGDARLLTRLAADQTADDLMAVADHDARTGRDMARRRLAGRDAEGGRASC